MMKKVLFLGTLCGVLLCHSWGHAGMSGRYALDKEPLMKRMVERIEKLPPERQGFAKMAIDMIKGMTMFIDLGQDGRASMELDMSLFGRRRQQTSIGTWKMDGKALTIDVKPDTQGRPTRGAKPQALRCDVDGKRIACRNESGRGNETMYFDKISDVAKVATPSPVRPPATQSSREPKLEAPTSRPALNEVQPPASQPAVR